VVEHQFFKDRLRCLFKYSILPYMAGTGALHHGDSDYPCRWALNVSVRGDALLSLDAGHHAPSLFANPGQPFPSSSLDGIEEQGHWHVHADDLRASNASINPAGISFLCRPREIILDHVPNAGRPPDTIRGLLTNFDFTGLEVSRYGRTMVLDRFSASSCGHKAEFRRIRNQKEIKRLIDIGLLDRAILSSATVKVTEQGRDAAEDFMSNICSLLTFANLSMVNAPVMEYYRGRSLRRIVLRDLKSSAYHGNTVIENFHIRGGVKKLLEDCLARFAELDQQMDLRQFIRSCIGVWEGPYLENKVAGLIMSLEYLVTKQLIFLGEVVGEQDSIQSKLGKLNRHVRFIPRELQGEDLRTLVRNPLFHTGEVDSQNLGELQRLWLTYTDLLIRLFLRIIGYSGTFISRQTWEPVEV
jgi:hypothetical protein